jgi:hypothetical protein
MKKNELKTFIYMLKCFKGLNEYKKNPSKFKGKPEIPHYKDKLDGIPQIVDTNECFIFSK